MATADPAAPPADGQPEGAGARRLGPRINALLPGPRGQVLVDLARNVRDLIRGNRPLSAIQAERAAAAEEQLRYLRAVADLTRGDPGPARAEAAAIRSLRPVSRLAATIDRQASRTGTIRGRRRDVDALGTDVREAVAQLRRLGHDRPLVLLYHQVSADNPVQALLYLRAWDHGVAPIPLWAIDDLPIALDALPPGAGLILHLHWLNGVTRGAKTAGEAAERVRAFLTTLDAAVARGVSLAWTVHNVLPHGSRFDDVEASLRQGIADRAALVHTLATETPALAAPLYTLPADRTVQAPLPSVRGAYADALDRQSARFSLGIDADARVISLLGGLRAYKGIGGLLSVFDELAADDERLRLLMAGVPEASPDVDAVLDRATADPRVQLHARLIPADDLARFVRASDVVVLPYLQTLNSGVLLLAVAFDVPVVAPRLGGLAEFDDPRIVRLYEPGDAPGLAQAIRDALTLPADGVRAAAVELHARLDPARISDRLLEALVEAARRTGGAGR